MSDTERRKSATSLRLGTHDSRTTGHVTSEEKRNSEEDRRNEEIAQKKRNYMRNISWRYGRTVQLAWCPSHVYQILSLLFHEAGRILEHQLLPHHLMAMSALIKHKITDTSVHSTQQNRTLAVSTCSYTTNTNRQLRLYSDILDKLIFALRVP